MYRQEKYDLAEYHFRRALAINPRNSVLLCYVGMALLANQKYSAALDALNRAVTMDSSNPLARFKRATVLMAMGNDEAAMTELEALKVLAPKEASVYHQLGNLYKRQGRLEDALQHFTTALDLETKDAAAVRASIEALPANDDMDEI